MTIVYMIFKGERNMSKSGFYTPHLLVKRTEMQAISQILNTPYYGLQSLQIAGTQRPKSLFPPIGKFPLIPLFEMPDFYDKASQITSFVDKRSKLLHKNWNPTFPAFIDSLHCSQQNINGNTPIPNSNMKFFTSPALMKDRCFIPVLHSFDRQTSEYSDVQTVIKNKHASAIAVRLNPDGFQKWNQFISNDVSLAKWLHSLGITSNTYYLLLDLGQILNYGNSRSVNTQNLYTQVLSTIDSIQNAQVQTKVVLLATSVPKSTYISTGLNTINREEWNRWIGDIRLYSRTNFGDYGTVGIIDQYNYSGPMNISGKFTYTSDTQFLIGKNSDLYLSTSHTKTKSHKDALIQVMKNITTHPDFQPNHCNIDKWMLDVAKGNNTDYKSPTKWIRRSTIHHILFVLTRLKAYKLI